MLFLEHIENRKDAIRLIAARIYLMTKIPLKDYHNAKKLSTDIFAGRRPK